MATGTTNYGLRKPDINDNVIVLTDVADNMDDIDTALKAVSDVANAVAGGTWADYTPTWASSGTQPVLGNGTLKARWSKAGKTTFVKLRLTIGTTTTLGTNDWTFSLPVASASHANLETFGQCTSLVAGNYRNDVCNVGSGASTMRMIGITAGSFYDLDTPAAWVATNFLNIALTYEAA